MKKLLLIIVFTLISCGNEQELIDISLALDWYPNSNHAGIYYGIDNGYFEENDINVDVYTPSDPASILQTVASGRDEFGISYQPDLLLARSEGIPVVAVHSIVKTPLNSIMTLGDSGIDNPSKLKNKTIGYPGIPLNIGILSSILEEQSLTIDDVELVDVGFDLVPALLSERVDAVIGAFWSHESILIELEGREVNILKFEEWGIPKYHELVLVTSEEYLKNNEEIVEKFVDAFSRGYEKSIENNDESMEALIAAFPEVNVELETQGIKLLSPLWQESFDSDGMDSWNKFGDWMKDKGLISESLDVEKSIMK
ncbi:MAG: ABC transporter substrate-binding protein [Chloroflexota bacterium]|nr:MAG: ABC transporter substrate-binding protein [Chloroflexota bacterium]